MAVDQMLLGTVGPSTPAGRQMPASPTPMRVSAEQPAISPQAPSLIFGEVYDRNINDPTRGWAVPCSLREGCHGKGHGVVADSGYLSQIDGRIMMIAAIRLSDKWVRGGKFLVSAVWIAVAGWMICHHAFGRDKVRALNFATSGRSVADMFAPWLDEAEIWGYGYHRLLKTCGHP
jgi:hypothetical protein